MLRNITKVARNKTREIRPRKKGLGRFGARSVGINKVVDMYAT